jgi:hypothetical protein
MPNKVLKVDSIEKLVNKYFPAFVADPFTYESSHIIPLPAKFSVDYYKQGWKCTLGCGGCCPSFSKDWPEYEYSQLPDWLKNLCVERYINFNNKAIKMYSVFDDKNTVQIIHGKKFCQFLDLKDRRNHQIAVTTERRIFNAGSMLGCGIHKLVVGGIGNPLSCSLPLLDFDPSKKFGVTYITEQKMSGGGTYSDNTILPILSPLTKGVRCKKESLPDDKEVKEKIDRLKEFISYCGLRVNSGGGLL